MNHRKSALKRLFCCLFLLPTAYPLYAVELEAETLWVNRVELSSPVSGVVDKIQAKEGDHLKQNDPILQLDQREFKLAIDGLSAKLMADKVVYEEAKRELARNQDMYDRTMLAEHDLQVTKNNKAQAEANFKLTQAALERARLDHIRSRISCPFDCVVIGVMARPGQAVVPATELTPLAVVADATMLNARAWLLVSDAVRYRGLKPAAVVVNGKRYSVLGQRVALEPADAQGRYAFDVYFKPESNQFYAGQKATIVLP